VYLRCNLHHAACSSNPRRPITKWGAAPAQLIGLTCRRVPHRFCHALRWRCGCTPECASGSSSTEESLLVGKPSDGQDCLRPVRRRLGPTVRRAAHEGPVHEPLHVRRLQVRRILVQDVTGAVSASRRTKRGEFPHDVQDAGSLAQARMMSQTLAARLNLRSRVQCRHKAAAGIDSRLAVADARLAEESTAPDSTRRRCCLRPRLHPSCHRRAGAGWAWPPRRRCRCRQGASPAASAGTMRKGIRPMRLLPSSRGLTRLVQQHGRHRRLPEAAAWHGRVQL